VKYVNRWAGKWAGSYPKSILTVLIFEEIGVALTKAFTCQLVALACFAIAMGRATGAIDEIDGEKNKGTDRATLEAVARIGIAATRRSGQFVACELKKKMHCTPAARLDAGRVHV
jgi:glucosamine 6-phosphate synthetase-like amidotransferase/phosphosugar isomerase protein